MDDFQSILNAMTRTALDPQTAAVILAVIGLNIHFGYTGLLNIGQSAFMLLGAYGFAITIDTGNNMWLGVAVGLALAFVFALVLGIPTLKLRGDYLAIVTISAAEIIRYLGRSGGIGWISERTGGSQGIPGSRYNDPFRDLSFLPSGETQLLAFNYSDIAGGAAWVRVLGWVVIVVLIVLTVRVARGKTPLVGGARTGVTIALIVAVVLAVLFVAPVNKQNTGNNGWWFTLVTWVLVGLSLLVVLGLTRSPWGRALKGVREDEDAMRSLGKNVYAIKLQALVIGGLFAAVGGMMYVLPATVQPDSLGRNMTFFCYTALLLGGAATIWGPVLGTLIFFVGRIFIIQASTTYLASDEYIKLFNEQRASQIAFIAIGLALMLLVIFRPQGILGDKRELRFSV